MTEQLVKIITEKAKSSEQNEKNGDTFVLIALQTVEKQPQLAFELGIRSLGFGNPAQIVRLIGELNVKNPELAERLYLATLNNAKNKYNLRFISRLSIKALTDYKGKPLSDSVRKSFLLFLSNLLSRSATGSEQERPVLCEPAIVATPILDKFNTYLPELVQTVRRQIELCQPYLPNANSEAIRSDLKTDSPKTVEELVSAAQETKDKGLKLKHYYEAIVKLEGTKSYDEILSLLNGVTEDDRESLGKDPFGMRVWDGWYSQYALLSATQYAKNKDLPSVYKIVNATPKNVRPSVRINLIYDLPVNEYQVFILENLDETRKELTSIDILPATKADYFLSLFLLYVKTQPTEAESVFREMIKAVNKADAENPDFKPEKDYAPLKDYIGLPSKILETNEVTINNDFADLSSRRTRVRFKLGLLESSLVNYVTEKKKFDDETKKYVDKKIVKKG